MNNMQATINDELFFENDLDDLTQDRIIRLVKSGYFNQYMPSTTDELLIKAYEAGWEDAIEEAAASVENASNWRTDAQILNHIKG
jgi:hypothetical protein